MSANSRPQPRFTEWQKRAHVQSLLRLGGGDRPPGYLMARYADQVGVRRETLYRWVGDESLRGSDDRTDQTKQNGRKGRFEVDIAMITVVAQEQSFRRAWEKLRDAHIVDISYATFCRALDRADPAVLHGALSGRKEMANNRVYLKNFVPHRCHVYHLDHSEVDLFALPNHRYKEPVRHHFTVITDGYSGFIWTFLWLGKPNSQMIAAALASVCVEQVVDGVSVGGIPQQLVLDNAAEHFAKPVREACLALGVVIAPTSAYSSWQNGKAERTVDLVNERLSATAPGAIRVGTDRSSTRFLASTRSKSDLESLWTTASLRNKLTDVTHAINTGIHRSDRGGLTRLELFAQDPTERLFLSDEAARMLSLPSDKESYRSSKSGIHFDTRNYVSGDIFPGRSYRVHYLPENTDFVEVFDQSGGYVTRAFNQETISKKEKSRMFAHRARHEKDVNAITEGVKRHRRHMAALDNAAANIENPSDSETDDHEGTAGVPAKLPRVPVDRPGSQAEDEDVAQRHAELMQSPQAMALLADVASLNAAREAKKREASRED